MPDLTPCDTHPGHAPIDALSGPEALRSGVLNEALESRARLCFRALSLCLAALVLVLISISLHTVIAAFVDIAKVPSTDTLRPMPASLAADLQPPPEVLPAAQGWPHAIVVVISILLVGEVVLAIGLIRATFSLRVNADGQSSAHEKAAATPGTSLPGVELLKAATDALLTVIKGLPSR